MSNAGWYQDHSSRVPEWRYWDGSQWTDQTAPIYTATPQVSLQQPTNAVAATGSPQDPFTLENQAPKLFVRRIAAYFVDYLLVYAVAGPIWFVYTLLWNQADTTQAPSGQLAALTNSMMVMALLSAAAYFFLEWIFIRKDLATPGMRLLSLRIEPSGSATLGSVALWRAILFAVIAAAPVPGMALIDLAGIPANELLMAWILALYSALIPAMIIGFVFYIGSCAVLWNPNKQAWHDRLTRTQIRAHIDLTGQLVKPDTTTTKITLVVAGIGVVALFAMNFALNSYTPIIEELLLQWIPVPAS